MADGFRRFRVARKIVESDVITSFHLEPADGRALWPVLPGQYLTLKVPTDVGNALKTYSVSSDPSEARFHRITVKRETRPADAPDAPEGVGSCWLHDRVEEGAEIEIAAPRGAFVLDEESVRPVLLLSGGVGITPLLSMLHRLARTQRDVWFVHACENGAVHAMGAEVRAVAAQADPRVRAYILYSTPSDADRAAMGFDAEGMIDRAFLQSILPLDDYDVYLCGPTPFMVAMYRSLTDLGVAKGRIAYEFFGKGGSLDALAAARNTPARIARMAASRAPAAVASLAFLTDPDARAVPDTLATTSKRETGGGDIVFRRSGVTATWDGTADTLLEFAENEGLEPEFSCRSGICNSCRCGLLEGEVEYVETPLAMPGPGDVLICCARPKGRVVLDI